MKIKKISLVIISALLIFILAGCSQKVSESDAKFANNIVENMLIAENNNDYNKFTEKCSNTLKKAFTKDEMNKQYKIVNSKIGNYIPNSKKFKKAVEISQNGNKYIVIIYDVKYKNEPGETTLTATFDDDNKHEVENFFLNSPKIGKN